RWSLENKQWRGRARTIQAAHDAVARDLGESEVNAKVCSALWEKVIPGILGPFDGPSMLRLFAGRPLLILNCERDPNCPIQGGDLAFASARRVFAEAGATDKLRIDVARGIGHTVTKEHRELTFEWLEKWLKKDRPRPNDSQSLPASR